MKITLNKAKLSDFIKSCKYHLNKIDEIMALPESVKRGEALAKECNRFNLDYDLFLHGELNVPLDNLQKVLNKNFKF